MCRTFSQAEAHGSFGCCFLERGAALGYVVDDEVVNFLSHIFHMIANQGSETVLVIELDH